MTELAIRLRYVWRGSCGTQAVTQFIHLGWVS